jgi:hypothetical protein
MEYGLDQMFKVILPVIGAATGMLTILCYIIHENGTVLSVFKMIFPVIIEASGMLSRLHKLYYLL